VPCAISAATISASSALTVAEAAASGLASPMASRPLAPVVSPRLTFRHLRPQQLRHRGNAQGGGEFRQLQLRGGEPLIRADVEIHAAAEQGAQQSVERAAGQARNRRAQRKRANVGGLCDGACA